MSNDWREIFRQQWEQSVAAYRAGQRRLRPDEFLVEIGCTGQELYDFAEDFCTEGEPTYAMALAITTIRREYFLQEQAGQPSRRRLRLEDFPAKDAEVAGFRWLPRLMLKARAKLRGELPVELMYCCGGDRAFFRKTKVDPVQFLRVVWAAGDDDQPIIAYVKKCADQSG
jgi:hypothetical protein